MTQDLKVAIIADDKLSRYNRKILLNFINENVLSFSVEQGHVFVNQHAVIDQVML